MKISSIKTYLFAAFAIMVMHCSQGPTQTVGGSGSSTTNGITATVIYPDGEPARGVRVKLRMSDYVAVSDEQNLSGNNIRNTQTDCSGKFFIDMVDTGAYTIEVNDTRTSVAAEKIVVNSLVDTISLDTMQIDPYARFTGTVDVKALGHTNLVVQIQGLERLVLVDTTGSFVVDNLPSGSWKYQIVSGSAYSHPLVIDSVAVVSATTTTVDVRWNYSAKIMINTSTTGAGVMNNVYNFPLLVVLDTASNVDFSQCDDAGKDLRFTKADGTPLVYEIELWDKAGRKAAIWVKMDTVYGNSLSQYINLYYGNPIAKDQSDGAAVFDTASGFAGIWHLGNSSNDATIFHNNPLPTTLASVAGTIGLCKSFDTLQPLTIPQSISNGTLVPDGRSFTLSAWFQSTDSTRQRLIGIGHIKHSNGYLLECYKGKICASIGSGGDSSSAIYFGTTTATFADGNWHLATAVFDMVQMRGRIFVDGQQRAIASLVGPKPYLGTIVGNDLDFTECTKLSTVTTDNFEMGGWRAGNYAFKGKLDETRVVMRAYSADWVKLAYENQRPGQKVVTIP